MRAYTANIISRVRNALYYGVRTQRHVHRKSWNFLLLRLLKSILFFPRIVKALLGEWRYVLENGSQKAFAPFGWWDTLEIMNLRTAKVAASKSLNIRLGQRFMVVHRGPFVFTSSPEKFADCGRVPS